MKLNEAQDILRQGVDDYENGVITLTALRTMIDLTTENIWNAAYDVGFTMGVTEAEIDDESDDYETTFEIELDDPLKDDDDL